MKRAAREPMPFPHLTLGGIDKYRELLSRHQRTGWLSGNERGRLEYLRARRHPPIYDRPQGAA